MFRVAYPLNIADIILFAFIQLDRKGNPLIGGSDQRFIQDLHVAVPVLAIEVVQFDLVFPVVFFDVLGWLEEIDAYLLGLFHYPSEPFVRVVLISLKRYFLYSDLGFLIDINIEEYFVDRPGIDFLDHFGGAVVEAFIFVMLPDDRFDIIDDIVGDLTTGFKLDQFLEVGGFCFFYPVKAGFG